MNAVRLSRARRGCGLCGLLAFAGMIAAFCLDRPNAMRSYLCAYFFWLSLPLGSLAILLMHACVGGSWGLLLTETLEAASSTLPLMALLFLPIAICASAAYPWASSVYWSDPRVMHQHAYLNLPFFWARAAVLFTIWSAMALRRDRHRGGAGLVVWALTVSIAAIDWWMSLEPRWRSTVYGGMIGIGFMLSAFAFSIASRAALGGDAKAEKPEPDAIHDLANLLLAFLILWIYLGFSQFLISWSGNQPEEISWYLRRIGDWKGLVWGLYGFGFAAPFSLLLFRRLKRSWLPLGLIGLLVLITRPIEAFWLVQPSFASKRLALHWQDAAAWLGIGGLWTAAWLASLAAGRAEI